MVTPKAQKLKIPKPKTMIEVTMKNDLKCCKIL